MFSATGLAVGIFNNHCIHSNTRGCLFHLGSVFRHSSLCFELEAHLFVVASWAAWWGLASLFVASGMLVVVLEMSSWDSL